MPELPEVETLRRGLERAQLPGQRITRAIVANTKALKKQSPALFQERVTGSAIGPIERRGKYLLLRLLPCAGATPTADTAAVSVAAPLFLCVHLKMRGQLLLEATRTPAGKYHCVTLELTGGRDLRFYDMWTWGEMRALTEAEIKQCTGVGALGREPLEENWGAADLALVLQGRKTAIKPTLLDQRVLAGVGNIYADESLYRAKIHPERPAGTLTAGERERLADALRSVLVEAVGGGGTTSDNYVDVDGAPGAYAPRVYERGGQPCHSCGTPLTRIRLGGRGTVFCARCQV